MGVTFQTLRHLKLFSSSWVFLSRYEPGAVESLAFSLPNTPSKTRTGSLSSSSSSALSASMIPTTTHDSAVPASHATHIARLYLIDGTNLMYEKTILWISD